MAEQELVDFLISQGHSEGRAGQIAGNHPEWTRAELEKAKAEVSGGEKEKTQDENQAQAEPEAK